MNRILLLIEHRENSRLLAEWLRSRYQVIVPDWAAEPVGEALLDQPFDLCILCARTLDQLWHQVQTRRTAEQPVLLPFLLTTSRQDVKYVTRHLWQTVDELITQPIEKVELQARVEILLRSRQLSQRLEACESETRTQVTARQQAEMSREQAVIAQRDSDEQFRQMAQTIPSVFWLFDLEAQQPIYISPAYEQIWGRPRDEVYANFRLWSETIHPDDRPQIQTANARCLDLGNSDEEYRILRPDGSIRWIRDRGFVVRDADGQAIRLAGVAEDVTDRKQTNHALHQSEERYRTLFESIDEGFCVIEVLFDVSNTPIDYRFLETNPAFEQQVGLTKLQGQRMREIAPNHEQYWFDIYGKVALTGESVRFENYAVALDRWFDIYACRIGGTESRKVAVVFNNITDRKRIEIDREEVLHREQIARETAERANQLKDEFLAVLSHELRTPMSPILGWASLLQKGNLDAARTNQALATIERNAKLQVQLIDDLLDISRILQGKLTLNKLPVHLPKVIAAAIETVHLAIEAKAIRVILHFDPAAQPVLGDAARLQQVVWNLLSNAVKFTPHGGQVEVKLEQITRGSMNWENGSSVPLANSRVGESDSRRVNTPLTFYPSTPLSLSYAQITVTDSGKGIHPDFLPHVFEHFRQEDGATTRKFGGLGLGLSIARQIVELHGGTIWADSRGEGQGAAFIVCIPLATQSELTPTSTRFPQTAVDLNGAKILVVDDDADSREFIAFVLQEQGAIVTMATSGVNALEILSQSPPDLIISDIGMPDMDGYTLMSHIRQMTNPQNRQIPAIALTAYASKADEEKAYSVGFQKYIVKPIEPAAGIAIISELIQGR